MLNSVKMRLFAFYDRQKKKGGFLVLPIWQCISVLFIECFLFNPVAQVLRGFDNDFLPTPFFNVCIPRPRAIMYTLRHHDIIRICFACCCIVYSLYSVKYT